MHADRPREDTEPWYRQFWPWFIIALPATAVVAGLITLYIATVNRDTLVKDDYYKEGLALNQDLARSRRAADLGITADLSYDPGTGDVVLTTAGVTGEILPLPFSASGNGYSRRWSSVSLHSPSVSRPSTKSHPALRLSYCVWQP